MSTRARIVACLMLGSITAARSQSIGAQLRGSVRDPQGFAVKKAEAELVNTGRNQRQQTIANEQGEFVFPLVEPGAYTLRVNAAGFQASEVRELRLAVGDQRTVTVSLRVESATQSLTVTDAEAAAVNLAAAEQSSTYTASDMSELPMLASGTGRNFRTQVYLTPGVAPATQAHRPFAVSGARSRNNNYLIDSNDYNEIEGGLLMGRGSSEQLISTEAIEGIQVLTHNYKAEYGRQNGAIVSMVTKRGSNEWRGLLFHYLRNDKLDARNAFDLARAPIRFNQSGANIGGPLVKNRTFVFGNFESFVRRLTNAATIQTLRDDQRPLAVAAVRPLVALFPQPNVPGTNLYRANVPIGGEQYSFVARVDHELTATQKLFSRTTYLLSNTLNVAGAALQRSNTRSVPQGHSLHHIWTANARTVNEARFNYTRFSLNDIFQDPVELGDPAVNGVVGTVFTNGLSQLGHFAFMRRQTAQNNFQFTNDLSRVQGRHAFKTGVALRRLQLNTGTITPGFAGQLRFNSVADFLAGRAASYNRNVGNPYIGQRAVEANFYAQDDWQVTSRLVLNLGLRYELNTVPVEVNGLIADRYRFRPDRNNFAPRFGLAYRLDAAGRTALRAGYGIYYNVLELSFAGLARFNPPLIGNLVAANPGFPNLLGNAQSAVPSGLVIPDGGARQPFNQQFNVTLERELFRGAVLSTAYVGTLGRKLPRVARPNGGDAMPLALRPDPTVGVVNRLETGANSSYHGWQSSLQVRGGGLMTRVSYTFARFIDEVSDFPTGNQNIDRGLLALDENRWSLNRGLSDLHIGHTATIAHTYEIPKLRGVSVQGITTLLSGRPYTLYSGTDNLVGSNNNRILDLPGAITRNNAGERQALTLMAPRAALTPGRGALGTIGRNTERGDRFLQVNLSVFKDFAFGDRWKLQLRGECFNVLNTVNYNLPDGLLTSPNFGQALTANDPRQAQLALRLTF